MYFLCLNGWECVVFEFFLCPDLKLHMLSFNGNGGCVNKCLSFALLFICLLLQSVPEVVEYCISLIDWNKCRFTWGVSSMICTLPGE